MIRLKTKLLLGSALATLGMPSVAKNTEKQKPNIIYILADDLGYGDLGCYGQTKIETPNIDKLAKNGMTFTQHYSGAPVCAPSRCVLLTGKHSGHAYIRGNDEWRERGKVWDYHEMVKDSTLEGQRPLPKDSKTISKLLKDVGYKTGMVGKWGLGAPNTHSIPTKMGFDFFCGYNCQRQAHTYFPVHLYKNGRRIYLGNDTVAPTEKLDKGADPYDVNSYKKFTLKTNAAEVMQKEMLGFVEKNASSPFFLYWATPIPHAPLQAPQRWIDHYHKKFGKEKPYTGRRGYFPARYPKATYAAMVSYLDEQVGELVKKLKELGVYDNTLIVFTSDNGPTFNGGTESPWFHSGGPFKSEFGWGKCFVHEGGIRVPMIASWPGKIKEGSVSNHISAFWDVLPTMCDIAGAKAPKDIDGISYLPSLLGKKKQKAHKYLYWEFPASGGQQAIRMGKWKAVRMRIFKGNMKIKLYNLNADPREQFDIAADNPKIVKKMEKLFVSSRVSPEINRFKFKQLGDKKN